MVQTFSEWIYERSQDMGTLSLASWKICYAYLGIICSKFYLDDLNVGEEVLRHKLLQTDQPLNLQMTPVYLP